MLKKQVTGMSALLLAFSLTACQSGTTETQTSEVQNSQQTESTSQAETAVASEIAGEVALTLSGDTIESDSDAVAISGSTVTISKSGTYRVTGTLDDGQIIVDAKNSDVTLVLDGADITCLNGAPIDVEDADEVTVTLAAGTENTLTDSASYQADGVTTEADAALYSKADLILNGEGSLTINANSNDGIASRDTLVVESGSITVNAKNHGIKGKDYLMIYDGAIVVNAGGDGFKATNDVQPSLGYVEVTGGQIHVTTEDEGISAVSNIRISGAQLTIDSANNGMKAGETIAIENAEVSITCPDEVFTCTSEEIADSATITVNGNAYA